MSIELANGYKELAASGGENISLTGGGKTLTRIFIGPWEDRYDFIASELADTLRSDENYPIIIRGKPHPADPNTIVASIDIKGSGETHQEDVTALIKHTRATITATYQSVTGQSNPNGELNNNGISYIEEEVSSESEVLELDTTYQYMRYPSPDNHYFKIPAIGTKRMVTTIRYVNYTIHIPIWIQPPWDVILAVVGDVNLNAVQTIGSGLIFPASTLHFIGPSGQTHRGDFNGKQVWSLDLNFKMNRQGWHKKPVVNPYDDNGNLLPNNAARWQWIELDPIPFFYAEFELLWEYFFKAYTG